MFNRWYRYTFADGYQAVVQKLTSAELSRLTHEHGKVIKKEKYKG